MNTLLNDIDEYYTLKLKKFGATAKGVDWNSEESQFLRFEKLLSLIDLEREKFSLLDYGCGFGAMLGYMTDRCKGFQYTGFDISAAMIRAAKNKFPDASAHWSTFLPQSKSYDYAVSSGVFNVRLQTNDDVWKTYMHSVVHQLNEISVKGFSFNVLRNSAEPERRKDYLYYADPEYWVDFCKINYSESVMLLNDYPLCEFTIQVNK
jgi:cyclopropane fatty-acyl-phospholipid synthase-like methyltransferase